jgi:hypothetical protein
MMNDVFNDQTPVATVPEIKTALCAVRDTTVRKALDQYLRLLRAHYNSPDHTATTTALAKELGFGSYTTVNQTYGAFAHALADALCYKPEPIPGIGQMHWWRTIATCPSDPGADVEWRMRPELAQALNEMRWV